MFQSTGSSVVGKRHALKGQDNQDAYRMSASPIPLLSIADGHGGEKYFKSGMGSQFAVDSANQVIQESIDLFMICQSHEEMIYLLENDLSQAIHDRWLQCLEDDVVAYGTTLLICFQWKQHIYFMQLGDGRCVAIDSHGHTYLPIIEDTRFVDNQTASMSDPDAWLEFKVASLPMEEEFLLIGLFTDGVSNAFPECAFDDVEFYRALSQKSMCQDFQAILQDALTLCASYSKDDATGVLWTNQERICPQDASTAGIVFSKVPEDWVPLGHLLKNALYYKSLQYAHHLINTWMDPEKLSLSNSILSVKQIYFDTSQNKMVLLSDQGSFDDQLKLIESLLKRSLASEPGATTLVSLRNVLIDDERDFKYCYHCQKQVEDVCPTCGSDGFYGLGLSAANGCFHLQYDSHVFLHHLLPICGSYNPLIGKIIQHPKQATIWGMRNLSGHTWKIISPFEKEIPHLSVLKFSAPKIAVEMYGIIVQFNI